MAQTKDMDCRYLFHYATEKIWSSENYLCRFYVLFGLLRYAPWGNFINLVIQGGGHGGSHPHLVHEFISSLIENRDPKPNAVTSANWTCVGICAHESATQGGQIVKLPAFTLK